MFGQTIAAKNVIWDPAGGFKLMRSIMIQKHLEGSGGRDDK